MKDIREVELHEFDPVFAPTPLGPGLATEVFFVGQVGVHGGTSDREAWVLSVLAKKARKMFEFGTCTGKTTYAWGRNSPADAKIVTLTLGPTQKKDYVVEGGDDERDSKRALKESSHESFYYSGTDVEPKITQLFIDSKHFDETPYAEQFDLIFVDGSHAYSYVISDSRKALRMCAPGGIVLWHDYSDRTTLDVLKGLNELSREVPLVQLAQTTLVAYRKPKSA